MATLAIQELVRAAIDKGYCPYGNWDILNNRMITDGARETALAIELALLQKWLRDKHHIQVSSVDKITVPGDIIEYKPRIYQWVIQSIDEVFDWHPSYEEAIAQGIDKALKVI